MNATRRFLIALLSTAVLAAISAGNRATLAEEKTGQPPEPFEAAYQAAVEGGNFEAAAGCLAAARKASASPERMSRLTDLLADSGEKALPVLESLLSNQRVIDPALPAEFLLQLARRDRLTDAMGTLAAGLFEHEDPFARSLAEWAIATKVGRENGGQEVAWPRADPPEWFTRWLQRDADFLLDADYARLAIVWNVHHRSSNLSESVGKILQRARGAAFEVLPTASPKTRAMVETQLGVLESLRARLIERVRSAPDDLTAHRKLWIEARRAARPIVLANPAVNFDKLLFVSRYPAHSHRNITGSQYPWCHKPGGDLCVKTGLAAAGPVDKVLDGKLGPGHIHGVDLWWDADRVVFGYARQENWPPSLDAVAGNDVFLLRGQQEPTHLYEIRLDGTGLSQRTNHPYWSDLEPTYAADGTVVFASDRSGRSSECGRFSADHTVVNLYALSPDGQTVRRLSDNKDIDRYPHSLDNGLIAYTRWEYQERHFLEVHSIWQVHPNGTMADAVFNQHLKAPYGLRDVRSIPGSSKLVAIATGHHTLAYGPVVVVDPLQGPNTPGAIRSVTPRTLPQEGPPPGQAVAQGGVPDRGGLYQTPWALSDTCFLASYSHARPPSGTEGGENAHGFAVYLLDVHGNKELLHRDLIYSCAFPMPLRARPRPPVVPHRTLAERPVAASEENADTAVCYVGDVYRGLEGVPRGAVKYVRISQRVGWPLDERIGAMRWIPGNAWEKKFGFWAWTPVRVIGEVPVEADGSACFHVPADTAVYFQALDENHQELRRMRSHISFQPGEVRGCVGCHETRPNTPAATWQSSHALARGPRVPTPPPWGAHRLLGYEWLIQPVFDRHCITCHGRENPEGDLDLTSTRADDGFFQSYRTLFGKAPGSKKATSPLVSVANRFDGAAITKPGQFGSNKSRLVDVLRNDKLHQDKCRLDDDEWLALVAWIDANAPYYDMFYNRRPSDGGQPRRDIRIELPNPFAKASPP